MTPLQQAAKSLIEHSSEFYALYKRAVTSGCIPLSELRFVAAQKDLRKALNAELAQSVGPYAVFHGSVDSGEHGAFNLDLLKMIPRGAYLYLHPPQPQATTPALRECWYESNELKVCRKCGQIHDKAITAQGEKP